jgi:hypothetical protein
METNIDRSWSHTVVFTAIDLEGITNVLTKYYREVSIKATCIEGSKFSSRSLDEIFRYENPSFRRIESIAMDFGDPWKIGGTVSLGAKLFQTCAISVKDTDDAQALLVADEIEKRLMLCKPWYSIVTRFSLGTWLAIIALTYGTLVTWYKFLQTGILDGTSIPIITLFYIILPVTVAYIIALNYIEKKWVWLFPTVWFAIGRQKEEFEKQEKARALLLGGVVLTIILGIVANLITQAIT